jgi:hypothetical protein
MCGLERRAQANHCRGLETNLRWHQNRSALSLREERGGHLITGHNGIEALPIDDFLAELPS